MEVVKMMISLNVLALLSTSTQGILGLEEIITSTNDSGRNFEIFSGFRVAVYDHELRIKFDLEKMLPETAVQSRTHHQDEEEKKPGGLQKFGSMLTMIPLIIQMLSLPGAMASIKMSLLKSLVVGKLAILVMIFNIIRNQQPTEVVVVHQGPAQHHDHFYPQFHEEYEDDDKGWFG